MIAPDLFCCAGGASAGILAAGFDSITGVDIVEQPHYPFNFIKSDALTLDPEFINDFDYIWASPPCQAYTRCSKQWRLAGKCYPDLIESTRKMLIESGKLYTIENVPGAPLEDPVLLCGTMFGLKMYRHRLFESNFFVTLPEHPLHDTKNVKMGRHPHEGEFIQMAGHFSGVPRARQIVGCHWMNQYELAQCIPPAYSKYIAAQVLMYL